MTRPQRGIYRLVHFPVGEHEELVTAWLWSEQAGVVSHQTALSLHGLSDVLPAQVHLTLPDAWRRRFRVHAGVVLHADVAPEERAWFGPVPATSASRTLSDCAKSGLSPELLRQWGASRLLDCNEVQRVLDWAPAYTSQEAFDSYVAGYAPRAVSRARRRRRPLRSA